MITNALKIKENMCVRARSTHDGLSVSDRAKPFLPGS